MIVSLKIIIEEDKKVSLIIYKIPELSELLENLINVLEISFPDIRITSRDDYYHFTGGDRVGTFAAIKSFIEEVFIRYIDDDDDSEPSEFEKYFMI